MPYKPALAAALQVIVSFAPTEDGGRRPGHHVMPRPTNVHANRARVGTLAESAKEVSNITNQEVRSLHGGEMPTLLELRPVCGLVSRVEQAAQDGVTVEHCHPLRNIRWRRPSCFGVIRLIQEVCRRGAGAGEPVDADVGEELVAVD